MRPRAIKVWMVLHPKRGGAPAEPPGEPEAIQMEDGTSIQMEDGSAILLE